MRKSSIILAISALSVLVARPHQLSAGCRR